MPSADRSPTPARRSRRDLLTPGTLARLVLGWGAVVVLALAGPLPAQPMPAAVLATALSAIVAVIVVCSFGVVHQAEALARRLGDPYGTLVLTLSIVVIEVVLIASVLLGPGDHTTIARDSVMAVAMIILNLVVGVSLVVSGLRFGDLAPNRVGTSAYLVMLVVLSATAFALPAVIGTDGAFSSGQAIGVVVLTVGAYGFFLWRQTGAQAPDFQEVAGMPPATPAVGSGPAPAAGSGPASAAGSSVAAAAPAADGDSAPRVPLGAVIGEHRTEVLARTALLVLTVLPIVLLSQHMAVLLDESLGRLGAPVALSGVLIAMIVFTPETITTVRAALGGEMQRVVNLCHGALVSTVGLTIPTVLVIALLTGQQVVFAASPANLLLLGLTLGVSALGASSPRVGTIHGAAHLMLFALYGIALFS